MLMTESPVWSHRGLDATDHFSLGGVHRFQDYYNWTMTYRLDSTFPIPYGQFTQVNVCKVASVFCFICYVGTRHSRIYRVSGLSCPDAKAYLTVIFHSFLHNNNMNSDYILGVIIYFTPHGNCSSYF